MPHSNTLIFVTVCVHCTVCELYCTICNVIIHTVHVHTVHVHTVHVSFDATLYIVYQIRLLISLVFYPQVYQQLHQRHPLE